MNTFDQLYKFVRPYRWTVCSSLILLVGSAALDFLLISLVVPLFDIVLVPQLDATTSGMAKFSFLPFILNLVPGKIVLKIAVILVVLTLLKGICLYCSNYLMGRVGQGVMTDLRNRLFDHVIGQSMRFFSMNSTGRLMSKMGNDVEQVGHRLGN